MKESGYKEFAVVGLDELETAIKECSENAENIITTYLHGKGYETMSSAIQMAIPVGSNLKKHGKNQPKRHARDSKAVKDVFKNSNLSVTFGTGNRYGYLYFPNDGTNTQHHAGEQHFFEKGVEQKENLVIDDMINLLLKKF